jgi:uncharacterized membrane protein YccF (DUF307 family)
MDFSKIKNRRFRTTHYLLAFIFFMLLMYLAINTLSLLYEVLIVALPFAFASYILSYAIHKIIEGNIEIRKTGKELKDEPNNN